MIGTIVFTIRYNHIRGSTAGKNRRVKHAEGGVVCEWVTDQEVMTNCIV
jgi:hypothetical protein